jgi:hypothetical protein
MTSKRITKTPIKYALIVATTLVGTAWMGNAYADDATKMTAINEAAPAQMADTADSDQHFDLQAYGDRFKLAIKAIKKEAQNPRWGWSACDEDDDRLIASND